MARHVIYQFDWGFATYDHNTEQDRIDEVEAIGDYLASFPVTIPERGLIDDSDTEILAVDEGLLLIPKEGEARIVS